MSPAGSPLSAGGKAKRQSSGVTRADPTPPLLLVSDDATLADEVLRLSAAVGASVEVTSPARRVMPQAWRAAAAVLVGADAADGLAQQLPRLPARNGVIVVSHGAPPPTLWQVAVNVRAETVIALPEAAAELVHRLGDLLEGAQSGCLTVGVIGARGGSGTSTLAAGLALASARVWQAPTLLVDGDRWGGGIDLLLGIEDRQGLRWPDVATAAGRVSSSALRAALPTLGPLAVLSWDRTAAPAVDSPVVSSILAAAQRGSRLVVIDLPRRLDEVAGEAAAACDVILLLCPAEVRASAAAVQLTPALLEVGGDVRLVLRLGTGTGVEEEDLVDLVGLPCVGSIPTQRGLARLLDEGLGLPSRGGFSAACRCLLEELAGLAEAA